MYLATKDSKLHWFSLLNSLLIVLFLAVEMHEVSPALEMRSLSSDIAYAQGMVAMIMLRVLNRDLARYNENAMETDESGWKQVSRGAREDAM